MSEAKGAAPSDGSRSEPASEASPLTPWLAGVALALAVATLIVRTLTTGAGIELHQPGSQVLFDGLAFAAAFALCAARTFADQPVFWTDRWRLVAAGGMVVVLAVTAWGAPHPDLAWRTAATWSALAALGLTLGDLSRRQALARPIVGLVLACVITGAALALHRELGLEEMRQRAAAGELEALDVYAADFRQGLLERLHGGGASGPYVLGNLLACAVAMVLPLAGVSAWSLRRRWRGLIPLAGCGVLLSALVHSRSKGGFLAALGAGVLFAVLHPRLRSWRRRLLLGGAGLAGALLLVGVVAYLATPEREGVGLSLTVRLEYWEAGLDMWLDHPVLGVGLNQFREFYGAYKSVRAEETLHAHNALVQLLAETGVVGLVAALAFAAAWVRPCLRAVRAGEVEAVRSRTETAGGGGPAPPPPLEPAPLLTERGGWTALAGGCLLAFLLLAGLGDFLSAAQGLPFLVTAGCLPLLLWGCRPDRAAGRPLLVPAALAGAFAFAVDGLTDFGLHHAGVLALFLTLLNLGHSLGPPDPSPAQPRAVRGLLLALTGAAALGLILGVGRPGIEADVAREVAREHHHQAARVSGEDPEAAREHLEAAAEGYASAIDRYPWHADTYRALAAVLTALNRMEEAVAALRRSLELDPRAPAAWNELGWLLLRRDPERALAAFDRAVALYPHHPQHLLDAARARVEVASRLPPEERRRLAEEARDLLDRAEAASEATRLVRRRLTAEQREELEALRSSLE